jgi:peroxiredoxin
MPRRCAVSNAPAIFTPTCSASRQPTGPLSAIFAANDPCG